VNILQHPFDSYVVEHPAQRILASDTDQREDDEYLKILRQLYIDAVEWGKQVVAQPAKSGSQQPC
jgi:hypothetical protein